jgi:CoA:oxalate CoA-transferase
MPEQEAQMNGGSLAGLSVLELGRMVAAPYCAKLFADLGADVIKLEAPGVGDPARRRGPFPDDVPHPERSCLFLFLNTSKRSITLDLEKQAGRRIFRELVAHADVFIEDTAPGELERLELDYPRLAELNPRLVVTSITPFGKTGPDRGYRSHHLNLYHGSGHASPFYQSATGEERAAPKAGGYLGEYDGGLMAAVGTLAAVLGSAASGRGQHLDVSNQEAMMGLERVDIARIANDPNPPPRGPPGGLTEAKDGYVMITPLEFHQWQGLIRAMGNPEWSKADWCQSDTGRQQHILDGRRHVQEWAANLTRDEIYRRAQSEGTPAGPVRNAAEVRAWEQAQSRGFFAEIAHEEVGKQVYPTAAYRFSKTPWSGSAAPLLGQHNEEVYCERLGYSRRDLARLSASGVI